MELRSAKHQANLCEWRQMVYECRNSGLPVRRWCIAHHLSVKTYYYRQREVWKAEGAGESIPVNATVPELPAPSFSEIQFPPSTQIVPVSEQPVITIRRGKLVCEIRNGTDPELLRQILRLVDNHV